MDLDLVRIEKAMEAQSVGGVVPMRISNLGYTHACSKSPRNARLCAGWGDSHSPRLLSEDGAKYTTLKTHRIDYYQLVDLSRSRSSTTSK